MIEGNVFELLLPENFIDSLKMINLNLNAKEEECLLEVLSK